MTVNQIATLMNTITGEILGDSALVAENLSNIVDVGTAVFNATSVDNYVKSLVNHIGKVIFVNRPYAGSAPSVMMDGWEFGSVLEKVATTTPEATENESWELTNGQTYDPNVFYKPTVTTKFFNKRTTFEIPMSFTEMQVKESFSSAEQLNGFLSMLYNAIDKSMTIKYDGLIMRTINNMIGATIFSDYGATALNEKSGVKAVNLLYLYNQTFGTSLTAAKAITDPEFIRFASFKIGLYVDRMTRANSIFNIGGADRFTPRDLMHIVMLSDFKNAANAYLQSDTFNDIYTALPNSETVPFWQGSGEDYSFTNVSSVNITTSDGNAVNTSGILACIFDRDTLGVSNLDKRVTTNYNPKAEFYTNWYKFTAGFFNDYNEQFVVFFVA